MNFCKNFSKGTIKSIQEPIRVRTPNRTRFCGIVISVAATIKNPRLKTVMPLFSFSFPSGSQNPERKINVQQIHCCHI